MDNSKFIEKHNNNESKTSKLKMNQFGDMTLKHWSGKHFGLSMELKEKSDNMFMKMAEPFKASGVALPDEVDWVKAGAVTPVKDQGQCGSCWSFSATGALEGAMKVDTGKLVSLLEQQFVDCDPTDNGCNGGLMDNAFRFAEQNAICTEASYAYHAVKEPCHTATQKCDVGVAKGKVVAFRDVHPNDEAALKEAVSKQPVSIGIFAESQEFQFYHEGVLSAEECGGTQIDHGVLAVGYGTYKDATKGDLKYWKVKNSWGGSWGLEGYLRISREKAVDDQGVNTGACGILSVPSFPEIAKETDLKKDAQETQEKAADDDAAKDKVHEEVYV